MMGGGWKGGERERAKRGGRERVLRVYPSGKWPTLATFPKRPTVATAAAKKEKKNYRGVSYNSSRSFFLYNISEYFHFHFFFISGFARRHHSSTSTNWALFTTSLFYFPSLFCNVGLMYNNKENYISSSYTAMIILYVYFRLYSFFIEEKLKR